MMTNATLPLANGFELFIQEDESQRTEFGGYWRIVLYAPNGVEVQTNIVTWVDEFEELTREAEAIAEASA